VSRADQEHYLWAISSSRAVETSRDQHMYVVAAKANCCAGSLKKSRTASAATV